MSYRLDSAEVHKGARSLRIDVKADRLRGVQLLPQDFFKAEGGARARLTFSYYLKARKPGVELQGRINQYDAKRRSMVSSASNMLRFKESEKWRRVSVAYELIDDDPAGYHVGYSFRLTSSDCTLWLDDVEFTLESGVGRFLPDATGLTPPPNAGADVAVERGEYRELLREKNFICQRSGNNLLVESQGCRAIFNGADGAVISELSGCRIDYQPGQSGLFRDLFWVPEEARWGADTWGGYELGEVAVQEEGLSVSFTRKLGAPQLAGLNLTKRYLIEPGLRRIAALVEVSNGRREDVELRYWSWHRFHLPPDASYAFQGEEPLQIATLPPHTFYRPHHSQWVKVADQYYLGWDAAWATSEPVFLDRLHLWNDRTQPAIGLIGKAGVIRRGKVFKARITYNRITERITTPAPLKTFKLVHPYGSRKRLAYRASIHNHSRYTPAYTHAPVPSDERLCFYRDYECEPPYRVVSITEHSRLTLPTNTDPPGQIAPAWGVEGMLFVPGGELTMGSRYAVKAGDIFGEINCVGLPTESSDPTDQQSFYHSQSSKVEPGSYLKHLVKAGVYVGLCHPNAHLDAERVHRWTASGYNYDELDAIFGNPEKGISPLEQFPLGLEIGNQGYDFTDRSNFTNAEAKWDMLLARGFRLVGTCSDDSHGRSACGGWIVALIDELTQKEFMESLLSGNFYASQGPQITAIEVKDKNFSVATDKPARIEFIGKGGVVLLSQEQTLQAAYTIKGEEVYVRARVTRECPELKREVGGGIGLRRSAWTNPIYLEE